MESLMHVDILELESDTKLFHHHVVGNAFFNRSWREAFIFTAIVKDQSIKKVCEYLIAALVITLFIVIL